MTMLFVCHSVADTDASLAVAKEISEPILFLSIGIAARDKLKSLGNHIALDTLLQIDMNTIENGSLPMKKIGELATWLKQKAIDRALIGVPSKENAQTAFQVAALLQESLEDPIPTVVYNTYLYQEKSHYFEKFIGSDISWQSGITWAMSTESAKNRLKSRFLRHGLTTPKIEVVGNPVFDDTGYSSDEITIRETKKALNISGDTRLLFISCSKNAEDDIVLLEAIFSALQADTSLQSKITICLGLHPGAMQDTLIKLLEHILMRCQVLDLRDTVRIMLSEKLAEKINRPDLLSDYGSAIIHSNMTSTQVAALADGVASYQPAALLTQALLQGKKTYSHDVEKPSDVQCKQGSESVSIATGPFHLPAFLQSLAQPNPPREPIDNLDRQAVSYEKALAALLYP